MAARKHRQRIASSIELRKHRRRLRLSTWRLALHVCSVPFFSLRNKKTNKKLLGRRPVFRAPVGLPAQGRRRMYPARLSFALIFADVRPRHRARRGQRRKEKENERATSMCGHVEEDHDRKHVFFLLRGTLAGKRRCRKCPKAATVVTIRLSYTMFLCSR